MVQLMLLPSWFHRLRSTRLYGTCHIPIRTRSSRLASSISGWEEHARPDRSPISAVISLPLNPRSGYHVFGFHSFSLIMQLVDDGKKGGGLGVKI
jgi:hypothetical protein